MTWPPRNALVNFIPGNALPASDAIAPPILNCHGFVASGRGSGAGTQAEQKNDYTGHDVNLDHITQTLHF